jgi:hypothetical protein
MTQRPTIVHGEDRTGTQTLRPPTNGLRLEAFGPHDTARPAASSCLQSQVTPGGVARNGEVSRESGESARFRLARLDYSPALEALPDEYAAGTNSQRTTRASIAKDPKSAWAFDVTNRGIMALPARIRRTRKSDLGDGELSPIAKTGRFRPGLFRGSDDVADRR